MSICYDGHMVREAAKKIYFLVARPPRGGGRGKGRATKKKQIFLKLEKKASVVEPLKNKTFFAASLNNDNIKRKSEKWQQVLQEKSGDDKNAKFAQDFKTLADVLIQVFSNVFFIYIFSFLLPGIFNANLVFLYIYTVCPRSSYPFFIVIYNIKWVTISWTHNPMVDLIFELCFGITSIILMIC